MSRRLPPSAASRLVDALVARYPRAGWDGLPPVPSSDDGAVLDADALAMRAELAPAGTGAGAGAAEVDEVAQQRGAYPGHVALPYWASQRAYDAGHVPADGGDWRMANANSRLVAFALHERGIPVEWADGATVPPEAARLD